MLGGFAQNHTTDGQQHETLQAIAFGMSKERSGCLLHHDCSQHDEKQRDTPNRLHTRLPRLRDQQGEQQEEGEMQAYLGAEEPAYRNGPSANQRSEKYSVSQFCIVKKSAWVLSIE